MGGVVKWLPLCSWRKFRVGIIWANYNRIGAESPLQSEFTEERRVNMTSIGRALHSSCSFVPLTVNVEIRGVGYYSPTEKETYLSYEVAQRLDARNPTVQYNL